MARTRPAGSTSTPHLEAFELELAAFERSPLALPPHAATHLAGCERCQQRVSRLQAEQQVFLQRYPTSHLQALAQSPTPRRTGRVLGVLTCIAAAILAVTLPPGPVAATRSPALARLVDEQVRVDIVRAFVATGSAHAADTAQLVDRKLTDFVAAWQAASDELNPLEPNGRRAAENRRTCLDERLRGVLALVAELGDADLEVVRNASTAIHRVVDLTSCARSADASPPPTMRRSRQHAVQDMLASADAARLLGKSERATELAKRALAAAERLDEPSSIAQAKYRLGLAYLSSQRFVAARQLLEASVGLAQDIGDRDLELAAAAVCITTAYELADYTAADHWHRLARNLAIDLDVDAHTRGLIALNASSTAMARQDHPLALHRLDKAIEQLQHSGIAGRPGLATAYLNRSIVLKRLHRYDESLAALDRSLDIHIETNGARHPRVGGVWLNRSSTLIDMGSLRTAEPALMHAIEIFDENPGEGYLHAAAYGNASVLAIRRGDYERAEHHARRSLELAQPISGPHNHLVATALENLGVAQLMRDNLEAARANLERALAIHERASDHPQSIPASTILALTEVDVSTGALGLALERRLQLRDRALAHWNQDDPRLAMIDHELAKLLLRMDRPRAAWPYSRDAVRRAMQNPVELTAADILVTHAHVALAHGQIATARDTVARARALQLEGNTAPELRARLLHAAADIASRNREPDAARVLATTAQALFASSQRTKSWEARQLFDWQTRHAR